MKRSIIVISVCERAKKLVGTNYWECYLHFKGCYAGKLIRGVYGVSGHKLITNREYLLFLKIRKIESGLLHGDIYKARLVSEVQCEL